MDDRPTPIGKLPQAREYAQLLSNFAVEHPLEFSIIDVMHMQSFVDLGVYFQHGEHIL